MSSMKRPNLYFNVICLLIVSEIINSPVMSALPNDPVVKIRQGFVRGTKMLSIFGREFAAFRGIPYAKPPLGQLRFKPPLQPDKWDGTFNATQDSPLCAQLNIWTGNITDEEDCLTLNVYTPQIGRGRRLPVLVYIHEGGFVSGESSSTNKPPQRLMDKNIVVVLIQYRLGPFGFLSTKDEAAPGNFGMLDQVLALKWVQRNIAAFGGDPTRVTISGQSAGGVSVILHLVSPLSRGLFRGAIAQSGSPLAPWAFGDPLPWAQKLGQELQCNVDTTTVLVECLRSKSASDIIDATIRIQGYDLALIPFKPVVDRSGGGRFLPDSPMKLLQEGRINKVPLITGATRDDAGYVYYGNMSDFDVIDQEFFDVRLPQRLKSWTTYELDFRNLSYGLKELYFDVIDINNRSQVIQTVIDFVTDMVFKAPAVLAVKLLANNIPVYMYSFEYAGNVSRTNFTGGIEVIHEDDLNYIFNRTVLNEEDQRMSNTLLQIFENFMTDKNPNPNDRGVDWTPTASEDPLSYLYIGDDAFEMKRGYLTERMNFWNNIMQTIMSR